MTNTICPECGSTFDPSAGFCPKCGREVKATQSPKTYQVPDKSPEELMAVGFNHMADGSYDEGLACWNKAVDGGIVPDDDTYQDGRFRRCLHGHHIVHIQGGLSSRRR